MKRAPVQLALFGPRPVHLFRWEAPAVAVPPRGNPVGLKLAFGAHRCVACRADMEFVAMWADCDCCPGIVGRAVLEQTSERAA